jgi:hypothetical protein
MRPRADVVVLSPAARLESGARFCFAAPMTLSIGTATSTPAGVIYSSQSANGRDAAKWLVVRQEGADGPAEIVFRHGHRIDGLAVDANDHVHVVTSDGFYVALGAHGRGAPEKVRIAKGLRGAIVAVFGDRVLVSTGSEGALFELDRQGKKPTFVERLRAHPGKTSFVSSMDGRSASDVWVGTDDGAIFHDDGSGLVRVETPRLGPCNVAIDGDDVVLASHFGVFRGGRAGFALQVPGRNEYGARHAGRVYVASYSGGVHVVDGGALRPVWGDGAITGLDGGARGAGAFLCVRGMFEELVLVDAAGVATERAYG